MISPHEWPARPVRVNILLGFEQLSLIWRLDPHSTPRPPLFPKTHAHTFLSCFHSLSLSICLLFPRMTSLSRQLLGECANQTSLQTSTLCYRFMLSPSTFFALVLPKTTPLHDIALATTLFSSNAKGK